jgi:Pro-kumamolisin, activation domain/Bacterial Ig-like domain (group 3)
MGTPLPRFSCLVVFFCFVAVVSFGQQVSPRPLITRPVVESELTTLKGNTHPLAQPQFDIGAAAPEVPMNRMLLVLKRSPEQEYSLRTLLDNQQDKASAHYHKWLTPDQFGTAFGPADQDMQIVTGWLQSHGFEVNRVSRGRTVIEFSGTEAQIEEALHTSIHKYAVNGEEHWANASDPQIPAALAPVVAGVWSLHDFKKKANVRIAPERIPAEYERGKSPQATFSPPGGDVFALGPADYAAIYNINPVYQTNNGGGEITIGVVGRSNLFNAGADVNNFRNVFNLCCGTLNIVLDGPDPGDLGGGEEIEATLDASWSGAVAPQATVDLVVSASTNTTDGVDLSELYIIDNNLADVMTESFSTCELEGSAEAQAISTLAEQAAAQGITYFVSSGDSGEAGCTPTGAPTADGRVSVNLLSSTAYTVAVGGTAFNEHGQPSKYWNSSNGSGFESAISYIPEDVWNESCPPDFCSIFGPMVLAGGGGASVLVGKPPFQSLSLAGMPNDSARDVPDVSLSSAVFNDPYLLCAEGSCVPDSQGFISFFAVGGTSAAAPSFAGIMALVDLEMFRRSNNQVFRQGQADYVLYSLAAGETPANCNASSTTTAPGNTCIFNDVTLGNNSVPGESGYGTANAQFKAGSGYDLASGLGSVNVANLVNAWGSANFNATTTTIKFASGNPGTIQHGTAVTFDVAVASNSGVPTGDVGVKALSTSQSSGLGFATLSNGNGSLTTDALPGGTQTILAYYPGDGKFGSSISLSDLLLTVTPENSTTKIEAIDQYQNAFTTGPYGSFVYVRADVKGQSGHGVPTGSVSFTDSSQTINHGPYALNSQGNTAMLDLTTFFSVGQHSITGSYPGDTSFIQSTSSPVSFSITQANTSTGLTSAGAPQGATLTANISTASLGNPPTGSVTFLSGSNNLGSAGVVTSNGLFGFTTTATLNATQLANGQYTITANYAGDTNYVASSSGSTSITIQPDFSIQPSSDAVAVRTPGSSGSMTVSMTDLDGFTGAVTFNCSGLPAEAKCVFSPASLSATGSTSLTVTTTPKTGRLNRGVSGPQWNLVLAMSGMTIGGVFILGVPSGRRGRRKLLLTMLLGALCVSCGGGGGGSNNQGPPPNAGTPQGIYVVTLSGTSGSTTHSVQFGLGIF